ncbi:MAG TPA: hypothetical protein VHF86_03650 [Xanthomonadaceae bacterium]|nr:hypothetical protein [Xanthomonadaceae bacterium]
MIEMIRAMRRLDPDGRHAAVRVTFDDDGATLWGPDPSGEMTQRARFAWAAVTRVCFKDNGPAAADLLFVFTRDRSRALVVSLEAEGGGEFWRELPSRGLFPAALHERATLAMDGRFYCWPSMGLEALEGRGGGT